MRKALQLSQKRQLKRKTHNYYDHRISLIEKGQLCWPFLLANIPNLAAKIIILYPSVLPTKPVSYAPTRKQR